MTRLRSRERCLDTADALCVEIYNFGELHKIVQSRIAVRYDDRLDIQGVSLSGNTFDDCVQAAAVAPLVMIPIFFIGAMKPSWYIVSYIYQEVYTMQERFAKRQVCCRREYNDHETGGI